VVEFLKNNKNLQIKTDSGWSTFDGLIKKGKQTTFTVRTKSKIIKTTADHLFFTEGLVRLQASKLNKDHKIIINHGLEQVVSVEKNNEKEFVYDILKVEKGNRFFANDMLVSNCEFLIYDETLISSIRLIEMEGKDPIWNQGQVRWYHKPRPKYTYMVALDPSLGSGGDYSAIQVFELPTFKQMAEWHHNTTPANQQIRILQSITKYIYDTMKEQDSQATPSIFYSMENNTLGEAALNRVMDIGEENIMGSFLSEPIRKGHRRKFRRGFNTTAKHKIDACTKFKELVENNKMEINSKALISELKNFVASGVSFKGKPGEHDDLVSAALLMTRMMKVLADFDPKIFEQWTNRTSEWTAPMPIFANLGI